ncbi:MAG: hypothetical protein AAGI23_11365 [Bacteroidota bacterium]
MPNFEDRLKGGHPNSLGNTVEIVEEVLLTPALFNELFHCYYSDDEVVRLRVSNAMKRIAKADKQLVLPYMDQILNDISNINQASTKWTLAQLFKLLKKDLTDIQIAQAKSIMQRNVATSTDWIVLNMTMETLGDWAQRDEALRDWLLPHLQRLSLDGRTSVMKKADRWLAKLEG